MIHLYYAEVKCPHKKYTIFLFKILENANLRIVTKSEKCLPGDVGWWEKPFGGDGYLIILISQVYMYVKTLNSTLKH